MEVAIKECMEALREVWQMKVEGAAKEMILQHREKPIREKYGVEIFMEAEKRLKSFGLERGENTSGWS